MHSSNGCLIVFEDVFRVISLKVTVFFCYLNLVVDKTLCCCFFTLFLFSLSLSTQSAIIQGNPDLFETGSTS